MKEIKELYTAAIKLHRVGTVLEVGDCEVVDALRELIDNKHKYGSIKVDNIRVGKRRVKCLKFLSSNGYYPVTKSKLTGVKESARAKTLRLMREVIDEQITTFRDNFKSTQVDLINNGFASTARQLAKCPITNKILNRVHVDHVVPFIVLADLWLENYTLYDKFAQVKQKDLQSWANFHEKYAVLALVGAKANVAKGSSGYRSKH